jgi:Tfp pilus assembly protein PilN
MNIRKLIVKGLYPLCSSEVQILLEQMQTKPDKFEAMFESMPYRVDHNPWLKALSNDNFELIDHVALRQQLKLLKTAYAKQLILEGLLDSNERTENRQANLNMFDSIKNAPTLPSKIHLSREQIEIAMGATQGKSRGKRGAK